MKEVLTQAQQVWIIWKLAIVKAALFSIVTLCAAWQVATAGLDVGLLSFWDKVNLAAGITVLWGNQMMSFFDKTAASIAKNNLPIGQDPTQPNG